MLCGFYFSTRSDIFMLRKEIHEIHGVFTYYRNRNNLKT